MIRTILLVVALVAIFSVPGAMALFLLGYVSAGVAACIQVSALAIGFFSFAFAWAMD